MPRRKRIDYDLRRIEERELTLAALKEIYDRAGIHDDDLDSTDRKEAPFDSV